MKEKFFIGAQRRIDLLLHIGSYYSPLEPWKLQYYSLYTNILENPRATAGRRWNAWPGTEGIEGLLSVAHAPKWRRQASDQIRSDFRKKNASSVG